MGRFLGGAGLVTGGLAGLARSLPTAKELIDARRFHYGYLKDKLKDKPRERCELNFHLLLGHIAQGASHAQRA